LFHRGEVLFFGEVVIAFMLCPGCDVMSFIASLHTRDPGS
jgi:hypothetical protein